MLDNDSLHIWELFLESKNPLGVLYHHTSLNNVVDIIESDKFYLTFASGANERLTKGKKMFYLSTTRTPVGEYGYPYYKGNIQVLIVLDSGKLAQRYKIVPIDYWGRQVFKKDEAEERVLSETDEIPASPYIKEIRIYIPEDYDLTQRNESYLLRKLRDSRMPVKVWDSLDKFITGRGKDVTDRYFKRYDEEFFNTIKWLSLDNPPKRDYYEWEGFKTDVHNNLKSKLPAYRNAFKQLSILIKKNNVKSLNELILKKIKQSQSQQ